MNISTIIFDLGGVIIDHRPFKYLDKLTWSDEEKEKMLSILRDDSTWKDLDLGVFKTYQEAFNDYCSKHKENEKLVKEFLKTGFMENYDIYQKGHDLFYYFKNKGYTIYILTNFSIDGFKRLQKFDFISKADGYINSADVHLLKPDRRIYRLMIEKFDLFANECLFLDDREANILSARDVGFNAEVYKEDKVEEILIKYHL